MKTSCKALLCLALLQTGAGCSRAAVSQAPPGPDVSPPAKSPSPKIAPGASGQDATAQREETPPELKDVPQQVLIGTDVEPLQPHLAHGQPVQPGKYAAEIGGAVLRGEITAGTAPGFKRQFKEPGLKSSTATYETLRVSENALTGEKITIIGLPDAILVFERDSGVSGIPKSLWIRYERQEERP